MIPLLLMLEAALELGLFLYRIIRSKALRRSLPCAIISVMLVVMLFSVTQGDPDNGKDAFLLGAPWGIFAAAILLGAAHFSAALPREYRRSKNELSPWTDYPLQRTYAKFGFFAERPFASNYKRL